MAAPKAPLVGGSAKKDVALEEAIFGAELKPHLVHETVRAELNARRAGTREAYNLFIARHPDHPLATTARQERDRLK